MTFDVNPGYFANDATLLGGLVFGRMVTTPCVGDNSKGP